MSLHPLLDHTVQKQRLQFAQIRRAQLATQRLLTKLQLLEILDAARDCWTYASSGYAHGRRLETTDRWHINLTLAATFKSTYRPLLMRLPGNWGPKAYSVSEGPNGLQLTEEWTYEWATRRDSTARNTLTINWTSDTCVGAAIRRQWQELPDAPGTHGWLATCTVTTNQTPRSYSTYHSVACGIPQ